MYLMRDWDSLRFILAIAREGGLSGAARTLGVNHATVSRQLDRAEAAAGATLFTRLPTGLVPTDAGQMAVDRAAAVEAEIEALDLELASRGAGNAGRLVVTVPPLVAESGFGDDVARFHAAHPDVDLRVLGNNDLLNLHKREADVAIRVSHDPPESLWGRVVARQRAGWFAAPDLLKRLGPLEKADSVPVISFTAWAEPVPKSLKSELPNTRIVAESDDMVSAAALVRAGLGITRMPHFLGATDPGLHRVPGLALVDYLPIWCLTHPDLRRVQRIADFMSVVAEGFTARRALYLGTD